MNGPSLGIAIALGSSSGGLSGEIGLFVGQLLQARHQHLRLDLLGDRLVVLLLDELARRLAGAEAADLRLVALDQFGVLLVEALVDLLAIDGHLDVLLARADVLDLDGLLELDRLASAVAVAALSVGRWRRRRRFRGVRVCRRRPSVCAPSELAGR